MKIKLAVLEHDANYLKKIVSIFNMKYSEDLEIYSFTSQEIVMDTLASSKIDVLLADDSFEIDADRLPRRCAFAYMVSSPDVETVGGQKTIFKFQKVELIYKHILSLYAEQSRSISGLNTDESSCQILAFGSASGGTGSSCMAAACALYFAVRGKKVLYLNLEKFGNSGPFFSAEGHFDMSDVVFAIKSHKANLALKLESYVRQDPRGVYFFAPPKLQLDLLELAAEETLELITGLSTVGKYDYLILDRELGLSKSDLNLYRKAHALVLICDGSEISVAKTVSAYHSLETLEQNADSPITGRMRLIYNKFSNKTGKALPEIGLTNIGGAPRYAYASTAEVVGHLSNLDLFEKIV